MEPIDLSQFPDERMDIRAWYPDLVDGLTDEQIHAVQNDLMGSYLETGHRPEVETVRYVVDVVTGRRTSDEVVAEILAQGRAWASQQPPA